MDTEEEFVMQKEIFEGVVQEAAKLIYASTASSSRSRTRSGNIERGRVVANERLMHDYFGEDPVYTPDMFSRRFKMSRQLFERIVQDLSGAYEYFTLRVDGKKKQGLSPIQKCTSAIRQLAYGVAANSLDEYLRMREKTLRDCLNYFCTGKLTNIMYTCVILHNMIIEDEGKSICGVDDNDDVTDDIETQITGAECAANVQEVRSRGTHERAANVQEVRSRETHNNLKSDLVEQIWGIQLPDNEHRDD